MRYGALSAALDERSRRLLLGAEAAAAGRGGQAAVARATGASPATIRRGLGELGELALDQGRGRIRRPGGGRKRTVDRDPTLRRDLEALTEPVSLSHRSSGRRRASAGSPPSWSGLAIG